MKKFIFYRLLLAIFICLSVPYCKKMSPDTLSNKETNTEKLTNHDVNESVKFELNQEVSQQIETEKSHLDELQNIICNQVDQLSRDVRNSEDGSLSYPNWVRFTEIAQAIDSLNETWNDAYGQALENIIDVAIATGATDVANDDEHGKDLLSDEIEEQHLVYPEDMASVCYENKFGLYSMRKCLQEQEDKWLESTEGEKFNAGEAPTITEEIDDEEYWTLLTCDRRYTIENKNVEPSMFDQGQSPEQLRNILGTIIDIVAIIGDVVDIAEQLNELLEDCDGSTKVKVKDLTAGIAIPGQSRYIGYVMKQKGQTIDFSSATYTKIKGKAKLFKLKKNGKGKRDRKNKADILFCAKEWNNCEDLDWPDDPGHFTKPRVHHRGKVKTAFREPKALDIEKSYHFVQFKFGINGTFVQALNLFGTPVGCPHW